MAELPHDEPATRLLAEGEALRRLARSLLDDDAAADVVQDGYLAALRRPRAARQIGPWLSGTVRRLAARWRRMAVRRERREQVVARAELDAASDPACIAEQSETTRALAAAVHALDEPFRTVIVMRFWHGQKPEAIARQLGIPVNTVRSRLQRGLARLRERLDERAGGRDAWVSALFPLLRPIESTLPTTVPAVALLASFMTTKFLLAAGLAIAGLVALPFAWPEPPTVAAPDATVIAPADVVSSIATDAPSPARVALMPPAASATPPTAGLADESAPVVPPWTATLFVIDENGVPVGNATVSVWPGRLARNAPSPNGGNAYSGRMNQALVQLRTDDLGRAEATLDREQVFVRADIDSRQSMEHTLWHAMPKKEVQLVLRSRVAVHGRVLRADGCAASGAEVHITTRYIDTRTMGWAPQPPATSADDAGSFRCDLLGDVTYEVAASWNGTTSFPVRLSLARTPPAELVLTFPGSITLQGMVVDVDGQPMADVSLRVWCEAWRQTRGEDENGLYLRTDSQGRFTTPLRHHGRYGAIAMPAHQPRSPVVVADVSPERPHAEVRLVVPRFDTIRGRVVRPDGTPLVSGLIHAEAGPVTFEAIPEPTDRERVATGGESKLDDEGAFLLRVQPGTTWALVVTPMSEQRQLQFRREGIVSGAHDVVITATMAELAGCTIRGRVKDPTGQPFAAYEVEVHWADRGIQKPATRITPDGFEVAALPIGQKLHVEIVPTNRDLTTFVFGPFTTGGSDIVIDATIRLAGVLPVRVCEHDGTPARGVLVHLDHVTGEAAFGPVPVDADGRARLARRVAGSRRLFIHRDTQPLLEQEVHVREGPNPELLITLPAARMKPR